MQTWRIATVLVLSCAAMPGWAQAENIEFRSKVHDSGEAWLTVRNRGDEPVTLREFRWADGRASALGLQLEPRQQSSLALPRSGPRPLWISVGEAGWISEDGARAPATPPLEPPTDDMATGPGFVTVDEAPAAARPPAAPEPEPVTPSVAAPVAAAPAAIPGSWSVVLNSFLSPDRAQADARAVGRLGYRAEVIEGESAGKRWYRVLIRGYATAPEARAAVAELAARHGRSGAWILHD